MLRKDLFMRKTNKKLSKLVDDKSGVILVTVIFIVAMALIFITTALTISIAGRQRVYNNAKSDQARLTVTSLAQSIWQAIYSQQITDEMLVNLAKGSSDQGTLVSFTSSDIPGMTGGAVATAYFYVNPTNPNKINIECKCDIDGNAQYYTLVLLKNQAPNPPQPMLRMTVELGNPGMLNAFNFGIDASQINGHERNNQQQYLVNGAGQTVTDNIMFLHGNGTTSNQGGSGFYCRVICDGHIYLRDAVFTDDLVMVGENATFDFTSTSSTGVQSGTSPRRGNVYFWGSNLPFVGAQAGTSMPTFNNIYFDYRTLDDPAGSIHYNNTSTGFNANGGTIDSGANNTYFLRNYNQTHPWGIAGNVYYEQVPAASQGAYFNDNSGNNAIPSSWGHFDNGTDSLPSWFNNDTLKVDDGITDTIGEVTDPVHGYGTYSNHDSTGETLAVEITSATNTLSGSVGYYYINGGTIDHRIDCDVSGGPITIYVRGNLLIRASGDEGSDTTAGFYINAGPNVENYVNFVLEGGAKITVSTAKSDKPTGFIDTRCFTGSNYLNPTTINQNYIPRFFIFAAYNHSVNASALCLGSTDTNGGVVCTAHICFFPTTKNGTDGCDLELHNVAAGTYGIVYYGRIACGGMGNANDNGGNLNVPYCPGMPGSQPNRGYAYREATAYSVVNDECGYFTA